MELLDTLERYARENSKTQSVQLYLHWEPGSYSYLFVPSRQTLNTLTNRIGGATFKRKFGSTVFQILSFAPQFCRLLPIFSRHNVLVPTDNRYDLVIVGSHIKLLSFSNYTVTTISGNKANLSRQIEFRQSLPNEINVPKIHSYDDEFPHFTEELILGREVMNPLTEWQYVENALNQLRPLYVRNREWYPMEEIMMAIRDNFSRLNLQDDSIIRQSFDLLENYSLPNGLYKGTIHGDLHSGNILVSDNVYILDWEQVNVNLLITDFFKIFDQYYEQTSSVKPYLQALRGSGLGWKIFCNYSKSMGETICRSNIPFRGLPLLYPLYNVSQKKSKKIATSSMKYNILQKLIDEFSR